MDMTRRALLQSLLGTAVTSFLSPDKVAPKEHVDVGEPLKAVEPKIGREFLSWNGEKKLAVRKVDVHGHPYPCLTLFHLTGYTSIMKEFYRTFGDPCSGVDFLFEHYYHQNVRPPIFVIFRHPVICRDGPLYTVEDVTVLESSQLIYSGEPMRINNPHYDIEFLRSIRLCPADLDVRPLF